MPSHFLCCRLGPFSRAPFPRQAGAPRWSRWRPLPATSLAAPPRRASSLQPWGWQTCSTAAARCGACTPSAWRPRATPAPASRVRRALGRGAGRARRAAGRAAGASRSARACSPDPPARAVQQAGRQRHAHASHLPTLPHSPPCRRLPAAGRGRGAAARAAARLPDRARPRPAAGLLQPPPAGAWAGCVERARQAGCCSQGALGRERIPIPRSRFWPACIASRRRLPGPASPCTLAPARPPSTPGLHRGRL